MPTKREERDSNPRALSDKRFSRPPRYDRFAISPILFLYTSEIYSEEVPRYERGIQTLAVLPEHSDSHAFLVILLSEAKSAASVRHWSRRILSFALLRLLYQSNFYADFSRKLLF